MFLSLNDRPDSRNSSLGQSVKFVVSNCGFKVYKVAMDLLENLALEQQQRLDLAEKTMHEMKGKELAEEVAELLGSNPGSDLLEFVERLRRQPPRTSRVSVRP
jgi:hypothetical protein